MVLALIVPYAFWRETGGISFIFDEEENDSGGDIEAIGLGDSGFMRMGLKRFEGEEAAKAASSNLVLFLGTVLMRISVLESSSITMVGLYNVFLGVVFTGVVLTLRGVALGFLFLFVPQAQHSQVDFLPVPSQIKCGTNSSTERNLLPEG